MKVRRFFNEIIIALLFLLSGCTEILNKNSNDNRDIITYCAKEKNDNNYIFFDYPQIADGDNVEKINDIVVEFVETALQKYIKNGFYGDIKGSTEIWKWNNEEYTLQAMDIDYKITRNDSDYLSITFEGLYNYKSSAHPIHYFDALIIDIKQCKKISLSDVYVIDSNLIQLVQQEAYYQLEEKIKSEYIDQYIEIIGKSLADNNSDIVAFFNDKSIGICIDIAYVLGDYCKILIDYDKLDEFIK